MTKKDFIQNLDVLTHELGEQFPALENDYQLAKKSMFNKNKKKCIVYQDVIDTLSDYIEKVQKLAAEYATCDILVEDATAERIYFSMPIQ